LHLTAQRKTNGNSSSTITASFRRRPESLIFTTFCSGCEFAVRATALLLVALVDAPFCFMCFNPREKSRGYLRIAPSAQVNEGVRKLPVPEPANLMWQCFFRKQAESLSAIAWGNALRNVTKRQTQAESLQANCQ
jgi:hypothetical protein